MGTSEILVEERFKMDEIGTNEVAQLRSNANPRRNRPGTSAAVSLIFLAVAMATDDQSR